MTNINNLPTMAFHFFEKPNKIMITDESYLNIITAELNINFDKDFILDAKSFDILKKLQTNRTIKVTDKHIIIKSNEGEYKCTHIDKLLPSLKLDNIVYTHTYKNKILKEALNFVSNDSSKIMLNGVLFNDYGDVIATDSYKIYFANSKIGNYSRWWSVPTLFIRLLENKEDIELSFTDGKVIYNGDYCIYSSLYDGKVPALEKAINNLTGDEVIIKKNSSLNLFQSESIVLSLKEKEITYNCKDGDKIFTTKEEIESEIVKKIKLNYNWFMQVLNICDDTLKLTFGERSLKINDKIIVSYQVLKEDD